MLRAEFHIDTPLYWSVAYYSDSASSVISSSCQQPIGGHFCGIIRGNWPGSRQPTRWHISHIPHLWHFFLVHSVTTVLLQKQNMPPHPSSHCLINYQGLQLIISQKRPFIITQKLFSLLPFKSHALLVLGGYHRKNICLKKKKKLFRFVLAQPVFSVAPPQKCRFIFCNIVHVCQENIFIFFIEFKVSFTIFFSWKLYSKYNLHLL